MQTYTVDELSKVLRKSKSSIYADVCRNPSVLPPILRIPGSKKLLFVDVENWMSKYVVHPTERESEQKRRRGAPTKRERLERGEATK